MFHFLIDCNIYYLLLNYLQYLYGTQSFESFLNIQTRILNTIGKPVYPIKIRNETGNNTKLKIKFNIN